MATKKSSTPVLEEPVEEVKPEENTANEVAKLKAQLNAMKAENERLKQNSVAGGGAAGGKSDYERVKEACDKAAAEGADEWQIKIGVRAPRRPAKEDPFYWLSVNGQTIQVPATDKYYDLALPFADALVNMIQAEWFANDFADNIEDFDPVTNPHRE